MKYINVLPKEWYIMVTEENQEFFNVYRKADNILGCFLVYEKGACRDLYHYNQKQEFSKNAIEISFEDFKRLVSGEKILLNYEIY